MKKLRILLLLSFSTSLFTISNAQYTDILNFNSTNGQSPRGNIVYNTNVLYGMTFNGGVASEGNIFSIHPDGTHDYSLHNFSSVTPNGINPYGSLTYATGKKMYGMTANGGANGFGLIFSIDSGGQHYLDRWDFSAGGGTNGSLPYGNLVIAGRKMFGMTSRGGANSDGNIFSIDTDGLNYKDLYDFTTATGEFPQGSLVLAGNMLYGMTQQGGANGVGTVFSIDTSGNYFRDRWDFGGASPSNGARPSGSLVLVGKLLFGMTSAGGVNSDGNIFSIDTNDNGTTYKDRWDFDGGGDVNGSAPYGDLTYSGKLLYGMTSNGGVPSNGNIFYIDTNGTRYTDLIDFSGNSGATMGAIPHGNVTLNGIVLYGMTSFGGTLNDGVVFSDTLIKVTATDSNVTCNGSNNGHATAYVTGGFSPYAYNWSGGHGSNATATGLSAGTFTCTVTDNNGLVVTTSVTITQPTALAITMSSNTDDGCFGDITASATANAATGGTTPYTYSWTGGHGNNLTATAMAAGSYTITATDAHGCTATASVAITQPAAALAISISSHTNEPCHGDANASVTANAATGGTTGYSYNWAPIGGTNLNATGLSAGTYTITVTDGHGCTSTASVTVTEPTAIGVTANSYADTAIIVSNYNGAAAVHPHGGTGAYTYSWSPGGETTDSIFDQNSGSYTVTVTDANGCTFTSRVVIQNTAGIADITYTTGQISIYPNPSNGVFTLTFLNPALAGSQKLEVYNVLGEAIMNKQLKGLSTEINISSQPAGVYLYRVTSDSGTPLGAGRLIIQK